MAFPVAPDPEVTRARARRMVAGAIADPDQSDIGGQLQRVCRAAVEGLDLLGAVIHVITAGGPAGLAATSDLAAERLGELLLSSGEGPALEAFALRRPVLAAELSASLARWPGYVDVAAMAGVGAVWSLPLHVGAVSLGVLDLYAARPRSLSEDELHVALQLAEMATQLLLDDRSVGFGGSLDVGLAAIDHHAEVHQAQGMVMVDLGVSLVEALARMRAHAYATDQSLVELARAVVAGAVLPRAWES